MDFIFTFFQLTSTVLVAAASIFLILTIVEYCHDHFEDPINRFKRQLLSECRIFVSEMELSYANSYFEKEELQIAWETCEPLKQLRCNLNDQIKKIHPDDICVNKNPTAFITVLVLDCAKEIINENAGFSVSKDMLKLLCFFEWFNFRALHYNAISDHQYDVNKHLIGRVRYAYESKSPTIATTM